MLTPKGYKNRIIERQLDEYLKTFGAVCIEGPKYCGKTWTGLSRSKSVAYIADATNFFQTRTMAQVDPQLVLEGKLPRLLDEWQEVPMLWDAVRFQVDKTPDKGSYLLTGSATPNHKGILHSGAGRIARIKMDTMSLFETGDSVGNISLEGLFKDEFEPAVVADVTLRNLIHLVVRGGWPGSLCVGEQFSATVALEYLKAVVEDDMFKVDGVKRNHKKVWALLHSLGRNESTLANNGTIRRDMASAEGEQIDPDTLSEYLNVLKRLFIIDEQPAFSTKLRSSRRMLKASKRHFVDPSLAVAALGATPEMLYNDLNTFGFLFEALCEHDLKIYAQHFGAKLYHLRDSRGDEVDAVIELKDGTWGAFEIKLGANQVDEAANNLLAIREKYEQEGENPPRVLCVVCGLTNYAYRRDDGVYVIPITALKP